MHRAKCIEQNASSKMHRENQKMYHEYSTTSCNHRDGPFIYNIALIFLIESLALPGLVAWN